MSPGRTLVVLGAALIAVGLLVQLFPGLGRLPGDLRIERPGFRFYFPLTTCLRLSVMLTLVLQWWSRR